MAKWEAWGWIRQDRHPTPEAYAEAKGWVSPGPIKVVSAKFYEGPMPGIEGQAVADEVLADFPEANREQMEYQGRAVVLLGDVSTDVLYEAEVDGELRQQKAMRVVVADAQGRMQELFYVARGAWEREGPQVMFHELLEGFYETFPGTDGTTSDDEVTHQRARQTEETTVEGMDLPKTQRGLVDVTKTLARQFVNEQDVGLLIGDRGGAVVQSTSREQPTAVSELKPQPVSASEGGSERTAGTTAEIGLNNVAFVVPAEQALAGGWNTITFQQRLNGLTNTTSQSTFFVVTNRPLSAQDTQTLHDNGFFNILVIADGTELQQELAARQANGQELIPFFVGPFEIWDRWKIKIGTKPVPYALRIPIANPAQLFAEFDRLMQRRFDTKSLQYALQVWKSV